MNSSGSACYTARMKKLLLVVLIAGLIIYGHSAYTQLYRSGPADSSTEITVQAGATARSIAQELRAKGLIKSEWLFVAYARFADVQHKLIAGVYVVPGGSSIKNIASILTQGQVRRSDLVVTVKEGQSIRDIATMFEYNGIAMREEITETFGLPALDYRTISNDQLKAPNYSADYPVLASKPSYLSYEGYIFPDTYFLDKDHPVESFKQKAFTNLASKITPELEAEMKRQGKTLHEVLTLASIVEKEAPKGDWATVAGVFYNRLKINMGLQSDPTVNYITGKVTDRPSLDDTANVSPWNTYKYRGLPPGPICNPGLEAIKAVLYPEVHDYYYFLNPPGGGHLIYAKSFEAHKANREKYLK